MAMRSNMRLQPSVSIPRVASGNVSAICFPRIKKSPPDFAYDHTAIFGLFLCRPVRLGSGEYPFAADHSRADGWIARREKNQLLDPDEGGRGSSCPAT